MYYLRVMVDRIDPYQANPLPIRGVLGQVELVREAATLVMLVTIGMLAGRTRHAQVGYTAVAFGVWDIFYYVFLGMIGGWPRSLFDWDILFLLPVPWWGPVLAPVSIALLMIVGGTLASQTTVDASCDLSHAHIVGLAWARHRARALRVHGRLASRCASRPGRDDDRAATSVQLVGVLRRIHAHGCAGGADWLANAPTAALTICPRSHGQVRSRPGQLPVTDSASRLAARPEHRSPVQRQGGRRPAFDYQQREGRGARGQGAAGTGASRTAASWLDTRSTQNG